ncbi:MAG TPA: response regulator [Casimicrobiaceae bacterium]|nr:response regulator [Casimicrobiaceae bacterium]
MSTDPCVLIVEDEPKLAQLLVDYLARAGYRSECVGNGRDAVDAVRRHEPDIILLDLMLPGRDGLSICRDVRAFSEIPIIILTARVEEIDRLLGLELGADDYICKPYSPREVVARVKAVLRRVSTAPGKLSGRLVVDETRFLATLDGHTLDLTPVELRLLATLASEPGRIFSRDRLLDRLYPDRRVVLDRTVDSHVKNLRRKLADAAPGEDIIRSIYGVGYKLELQRDKATP